MNRKLKIGDFVVSTNRSHYDSVKGVYGVISDIEKQSDYSYRYRIQWFDGWECMVCLHEINVVKPETMLLEFIFGTRKMQLSESYDIYFSLTGAQVGCQEIPKRKLLEIANKINELYGEYND